MFLVSKPFPIPSKHRNWTRINTRNGNCHVRRFSHHNSKEVSISWFDVLTRLKMKDQISDCWALPVFFCSDCHSRANNKEPRQLTGHILLVNNYYSLFHVFINFKLNCRLQTIQQIQTYRLAEMFSKFIVLFYKNKSSLKCYYKLNT